MMRVSLLAIAVVGGILAGCSNDSNTAARASAQAGQPADLLNASNSSLVGRRPSSIASLPDRGNLVAYDNSAPLHRGAATWHQARLSEAHALAAIAQGGMTITAPNGAPIRLQYARHIEHADGNWTWIGRPDGNPNAPEAMLTFGKDAVFGTIPDANGEPLQVTTAAGRTWVVETDPRLAASQPAAMDSDFLSADPASTRASLVKAASAQPTAASAKPAAMAAPATAASTAGAMTTVDLVVGYTSTFASRLGGASQALTRLEFMVDIANQAYSNSEVAGQLRLVKAIQVNYPDNTTNRSALFDLTGVTCNTVPSSGMHLPDEDVSCTTVTVPSALQPLLLAREEYHADLVSLVRTFQSPENQSCGVAWLLGGGQQNIDANTAKYALSVVSDSSGSQFPDPDNGSSCRNETLAHELGHNMGLAHDRTAAAGTDDVDGDSNPLDPNEYGRFPYSFGYSAPSGAGNFYTIMSIRQGNQTAYRVFSNPRVSTCGGMACGVADEADNARTLAQTMPVIAGFRSAPTGTWLRGDFDGDGVTDIAWRNPVNGHDTIWRSANSAAQIRMSPVSNQAWRIVGASDFSGDHKADILWHNDTTGASTIWRSGDSSLQQAVTTLASGWTIAGAGDFDGDGRSDLLLRNVSTGANVIWKAASSASTQAVTTVPSQAWIVAGVGDFDGDHKADILWHNNSNGQNVVWKSASSATPLAVTATKPGWVAVGIADFNGDGKADILWRNGDKGQNVIWKTGNSATAQAVSTVASQTWQVAGVGDFDGDLKADILWRNIATGQDTIWKTGNSATVQAVAPVTDLNWSVVG